MDKHLMLDFCLTVIALTRLLRKPLDVCESLAYNRAVKIDNNILHLRGAEFSRLTSAKSVHHAKLVVKRRYRWTV